MALLLFYFALAIGFSFLCSVLEAVLLSITPSYVAKLRREGKPAGERLDRLKRDVERPLAAILSLNTVAHTVGAAGVGAQAQVVFQSLPVSVISGVLTLAILIFSEIIPKTLGATFWRPLAGPSALVIEGLIVLMWPLVVLSRMVSRLLSTGDAATIMSREELAAMAQLGREEGVIDETEYQNLRSVMRFHKIRVHEIFTPRVVVQTFPADQTVGETIEQNPTMRYSRIPLIDDSPDEIVGVVLKDDILQAAAEDQHQRPLRELARKPVSVPTLARVREVFGLLLKRREHLAVVTDEFGAFAGVVTLEDMIETLIGREIMDEIDKIEDLRNFASNRSSREPGE